MWSSDIMYLLLFTTATGALVTILWLVVGEILERMGFLHITYKFLRLLLFFWTIPVIYVVLRRLNAHGYRWYGDLFWPTPFLVHFSHIFNCIWVIGMGIGGYLYIVDKRHLQKRLSHIQICNDKEIKDLFVRVCEEWNLRSEKIGLYRSEYEKTPIVVGAIHPKVILPVRHYEREELLMVLRHELMHIKHHDLFAKKLAYLVAVIHAVNPAAWWYVHLIRTWSEYACDYDVCRKMGTMKEYYEILLLMVREEKIVSGMAASLIERKSEMRKRVEHVKTSYLVKTRSKMMVAFVIGCIFIGSAGTVCLASIEAADVAAEVSRRTEVMMKDDYVELEDQVATALMDEGVAIRYAADQADVESLLSDGRADISWQITPGVKMVGGTFFAEKGQWVSVSMEVEPAGKQVQVGLMDTSGDSVYVTGSGDIRHVFNISKSGNYKFFVRNISNAPIYISGGYALD